ncbi:hypothetical protein EXU48_00100 [Occultella glacieicola]|uniref:Uncharacterized protein n=1 Tax=Occultella glacieicola TaxID=2518684 RepID=A0ABY2E824_9MICO|nr:hypothetical protein [Occultella glacieicola]TDE98660.1 hypothetical protein EXU48_00100 [Occultella glacieicola]
MTDRRRQAILAAALSIGDVTDDTMPAVAPIDTQHSIFEMAGIQLEHTLGQLRPHSQVPAWAGAVEQELIAAHERHPELIHTAFPWFDRWYDGPAAYRSPLLNKFAHNLGNAVRSERLLRTSVLGQFLQECVGSLLRRRRAFHTLFLDEAPAARTARIDALRLREEVPSLELLALDLMWHWRDQVQMQATRAQLERIVLFRTIALTGPAAEWALAEGRRTLADGQDTTLRQAQDHLVFTPLARWTMSRWEATQEALKVGRRGQVILEVELPIRSVWAPSSADPVAFVASPVPPRPARPDFPLVTADESWRLVSIDTL